ncbi:hypothetical protein [Anabaena catenula]|uniref:PEP-CTERM sorting domain-containing protein n=1 Tax=Anabaena catenula FACHB-362 TaxID=2692877 RepID=A0ABR8J8V5_9NOST|nr:hypothetical protein [Anabaena catenula]MBD2694025.1 hypothetical protein [Anabaena catenula FACHB-362]
MKLSRILPLVVGSAAAGILASSASPAHALVWTLENVQFEDGATATGQFDYDPATSSYVSISINISNGTHYGSGPLGYDFFTNDFVTGDSNFLVLSSQSNYLNLFFSSPLSTTQEIISLGNDSSYGLLSGGEPVFDSSSLLTSGSVNSTAVPFDIPGGATIPTVGSLFALALMRKAKKSIASKNRIASPVNTVVS